MRSIADGRTFNFQEVTDRCFIQVQMGPAESEAGAIFFVAEAFAQSELLNRAPPSRWVGHYQFGFDFFFETRWSYIGHRHLGGQNCARSASLKFAWATLRQRSGSQRFDPQPKKLTTAPKIGFRRVVQDVLLQNADARPDAKTANLLAKERVNQRFAA